MVEQKKFTEKEWKITVGVLAIVLAAWVLFTNLTSLNEIKEYGDIVLSFAELGGEKLVSEIESFISIEKLFIWLEILIAVFLLVRGIQLLTATVIDREFYSLLFGLASVFLISEVFMWSFGWVYTSDSDGGFDAGDFFDKCIRNTAEIPITFGLVIGLLVVIKQFNKGYEISSAPKISPSHETPTQHNNAPAISATAPTAPQTQTPPNSDSDF